MKSALKKINQSFQIGLKTTLALIIILGISAGSTVYAESLLQTRGEYPTYLPMVLHPSPPEIMLGVYTDTYLGRQSAIDDEVAAIDTWSGKQNSIVGTFIAFEDDYPGYNIPIPLKIIWNNGYTPFVNINTNYTIDEINNGEMDTDIINMAKAFKAWREDGLNSNQNRKAFVAPFPEMNGSDWVPYYDTPTEFKAAFDRVQSLFEEYGASDAVRWVFAPNGWSDDSDYQFEDFYPGDDNVEVIAFSAYNAGYCSSTWKSWDEPDDVFGTYLERMRAMAPDKPIIIAQTATTAQNSSGYSTSAKNTWLEDAYEYLATQENVIGVIYFNKGLNQSCDWQFYDPDGTKYTGYSAGIQGDEYIYNDPENLATMSLTQ